MKVESNASKPINPVNLVEAKPFGLALGYDGQVFIKDALNKLSDIERAFTGNYGPKISFNHLKVLPPKPDNFWTSYNAKYSPVSYALVSVKAIKSSTDISSMGLYAHKILHTVANKISEKYHLTKEPIWGHDQWAGRYMIDPTYLFEAKNCDITLSENKGQLILEYHLKDEFLHSINSEIEKYNSNLDEKKSKVLDSKLDSVDF